MANWNPRANDIFLEALEIQPADARQDFLQRACGDEPALRAQVDSLLKANARAGTFLESPAAALGLLEGSSDSAEEAPGTLIGPYKLLEQIGEGGFGLVFMAEQQQPVRRRVAVKVLKPGMDTRQVVARFEAERQALALMEHPNIARVLDAGATPQGRPYFVMELVRGVPITEYCDQNQLAPKARLELFISVCQALQHAHQKGIIHRDIKPSNVLITLHDGVPVVKIIDFGIAKAMGQQLTDKTLFTGFAQMIGTPLYMSPEQAEMSGLDIDTRTDIYSLGVLLYELLTGTTPFDKERLHKSSYDEIRRIIREEEPPKPSTRISTMGQAATIVSSRRQSDPRQLTHLLRGELDWIVMKTLEKDRNRRYETAGALARDVQRYLNDEAVEACPPSAAYRFGKFARRNRVPLTLASVATSAVVIVVVALAGGIGWVARDRAGREGALDKQVVRMLAETDDLLQQEKWHEALVLVERADKLLSAAGRQERPARLLDVRKELLFAERLENIYRHPDSASSDPANGVARRAADTVDSRAHWGRQQDEEYARAFRDNGIDIDTLEPAEAGAAIGRMRIRPALVKALDEWAEMRRRAESRAAGRPSALPPRSVTPAPRDPLAPVSVERAGAREQPYWKRLLEVARQADPDLWRRQVREAWLAGDRPALEKLADAVRGQGEVGEEDPVNRAAEQMPPATAYLLGQALKELGAVDKAMAVLRGAQRRYPNDFWLNDALGFFSKEIVKPPRYADAVRYCAAALAARPQSALAHTAVAEALKEMGALEEGVAEASRAIELDPLLADAWFARGNNYFRARQYRKAVADYTKALELDPLFSPAWWNRGYAYYELHQYDQAVGDYDKSLDLSPDNRFVAWNFRGVTNILRRHYVEAVADCSRAIQLKPDYVQPWSNQGYAYMRLRQYDKALATLNKALEIEPKFIPALVNRGCTHCRLQQYDKSLVDLNKAVELAPNDAKVCARRGFAYMELQQYDRALADYCKAIELDPKWGTGWNGRGLLNSRLEKWDKALADCAKAVELEPDEPDFQNSLAWLLATCPEARLRDVKRAADLAAKGAGSARNEPEVWTTLGVARYRIGDWGGALAALQTALKLLQNASEFQYGVGRSLFFLAMTEEQLGHKKEAGEAYDRAVAWLDANRNAVEERGWLVAELHRFRVEAEERLRVRRAYPFRP
jgi:serine/threonine protein kinase/tetratricopeptide (TPR) repeat protein